MDNSQIPNTSWHISPLSIADQQQHIEQSERLLSTVLAGDRPALYWSMAEPSGLVLGFSQKPDVLNPAATIIPIYHRRAGGTAVLVGPHLLSLDVMLPAGHPLILTDVVKSYRWFGEMWVAALRHLGIQTETIPPEVAEAQRGLAKQRMTRDYELLMRRSCYGSLSPYEVVAGTRSRRKVVGFDMIRRRSGTLLQAGILLHWETDTLADVLGHTEEEQTLLRDGLLERAIGLDRLARRVVQASEVIEVFEHVLLLS